MSDHNSPSSRSAQDLKSLAIRGVLLNWVGRGCSIVITFFLTPYLVRTLGDERYGLWSVAFSLLGFYALADLGLRGTSTKYIAEKHARGDYDAANTIVVTTLGLYFLLSCIVLIVGVVLAFVLPHRLASDHVSVSVVRTVLVLTAATFATRLSCQPFGATLAALARYDLSNALAIVSQLAAALSMVAVLQRGWGLVGMAAATFIIGVSTQVGQFFLARHAFPELSLARQFFDRSLLSSLSSFSLSLILINGARQLTQYGITLSIGVMLGPAVVAIYSIADSVVRKASTLTTGISSVVMPVASRLDATGQKTAITKMAILVSRLMQVWAMFLFAVCVISGHSLIEYWIGPGYGKRVYVVLCLLSAANVATMVSGGLPSMLTGMGRLRALRGIIALDGAASVVLATLSMPLFGVAGAAASLLLVRLLTHVVVLPWAMCRTTGVSWGRFALDTTGPALLAASCGVATLTVLTLIHAPANLTEALLQLTASALLTGGATFFICLPADIQTKLWGSLHVPRLI